MEGCNIIGISKGDTTKNQVVIGAHYDSSGEKSNNKPLRDNGVGVAVFLEVIRAYVETINWKGYHNNFTTIFVAFDLNTKEQVRNGESCRRVLRRLKVFAGE